MTVVRQELGAIRSLENPATKACVMRVAVPPGNGQSLEIESKGWKKEYQYSACLIAGLTGTDRHSKLCIVGQNQRSTAAHIISIKAHVMSKPSKRFQVSNHTKN